MTAIRTAIRFLALGMLLLPFESTAAQQAWSSAAQPSPAFRPTRDACDSSYQRGSLVARTTHSTTGWRTGGFASGLVFSVFGVAGATVVASAAPASPDTVPSQELSSCYRDGYQRSARARSRGTAFKSSLIGAAVIPVIYLVRLSTR